MNPLFLPPRLLLRALDDLHALAEAARRLPGVEERLAACVSCHPGWISFYRWAGKVEEDSEMLLMIKTTSERLAALKSHLLRMHPYEVPELLVLEVSEAGEAFLRWLEESTRGSEAAPAGPGDATPGAPQ